MKAVIIFNLGGPSRIEDVEPFLLNLFNDAAIIHLPQPFRYVLAKIISSRRCKEASHIYQEIGGGSPIVCETLNQRDALQKQLGPGFKVYMCMRYWHPMIPELIADLMDHSFEEIILLPLYPQYSTTTTGSFFNEWYKIVKQFNYNPNITEICCYPEHPKFIQAYQQLILNAISNDKISSTTRFLFSAHGLPEKIVRSGDPYSDQVKKTVRAVLNGVPQIRDWIVTYQSKVGPLKWLTPTTEEEIKRAGAESKPIAIVPISFVSEHSETLYELDILYKNLAINHGVPEFYRIPTVRNHPIFIEALSDLIRADKFQSCGLESCRSSCVKQKAA